MRLLDEVMLVFVACGRPRHIIEHLVLEETEGTLDNDVLKD
jgi:hypothetical protein